MVWSGWCCSVRAVACDRLSLPISNLHFSNFTSAFLIYGKLYFICNFCLYFSDQSRDGRLGRCRVVEAARVRCSLLLASSVGARARDSLLVPAQQSLLVSCCGNLSPSLLPLSRLNCSIVGPNGGLFYRIAK